MKKKIKVVVLTMVIGMPLSIQALTFYDLIAVWLVTNTIERVAGVPYCVNYCCSCECKKNYQYRMLLLKKIQNKKLKEKDIVKGDSQITFVIDDQDKVK